MSPSPTDPFDGDVAAIDWAALHQSASRLLRLRMRGLGAEAVEDAAQEVSKRYLGFVRRRGAPHTPDGLLADLCRKVAATAIHARQAERELRAQPPPDWASPDGPTEVDIEAAVRAYASIVFFVREYFALRRARCTPLADAKARGESLKDFAQRMRLSYEKVRQDWSRCVRLIHDAMRRKRLRLPWPTPAQPSRSDDDD